MNILNNDEFILNLVKRIFLRCLGGGETIEFMLFIPEWELVCIDEFERFMPSESITEVRYKFRWFNCTYYLLDDGNIVEKNVDFDLSRVESLYKRYNDYE